MRLELVWDPLSWQEAFLCLRVSNGEGPSGQGLSPSVVGGGRG